MVMAWTAGFYGITVVGIVGWISWFLHVSGFSWLIIRRVAPLEAGIIIAIYGVNASGTCDHSV